MKVFEYVVWIDEKKDKQTDAVVDPAVVIVSPTTVLAKDDGQVAMIAARQIPDEYADRLDRVQISVRPF